MEKKFKRKKGIYNGVEETYWEEDRLREQEINEEQHYSNLAERESLIIYFRNVLNDKSKSEIEKNNARNKLTELLEEKEK